MRIAITDDMSDARDKLVDMLTKGLESIGYKPECIDCYSSGEELLAVYDTAKYDIIFLDIYMTGMTGIDTAVEIRRIDGDVRIVFITSSNEFAAESYRVRADYYLLKPYEMDGIMRVLRAIRPDEIEREKQLLLPDGSTCLLHEISHTEYSNHKVTIRFVDGHEQGVWTSQAEMEKLLCEREQFATCTKGIIVNLEQVAAIGETDVRMRNGASVPVSRARRAELKQLHAKLLFGSLRKSGHN